jgi:hypothetical protein
MEEMVAKPLSCIRQRIKILLNLMEGICNPEGWFPLFIRRIEHYCVLLNQVASFRCSLSNVHNFIFMLFFL